LDLLEGVLIDLLKTKWETFVKAKFYRQFYLFAVYFFISLFAFGLRPKAIGSDNDDTEKAGNSTREVNANETTNAPVKSLIMHNLTEILCNFSAYAEALVQTELGAVNTTEMNDNSTLPMDEDSDEWASFSECPLLDISTWENRTKLVAEGLLTIGALYYILTAMRELRFLGAKMFFENLVMNVTFDV
jgi:transient receptor potential cation channel subfamily V member 5